MSRIDHVLSAVTFTVFAGIVAALAVPILLSFTLNAIGRLFTRRNRP